MLVIFEEDQKTKESLNILTAMYPNDATASFNTFMLDDENKVQKEMDGSFPKRITIFLHEDLMVFDEKNINNFITQFVKKLTTAAQFEPTIKKNLEIVDILGHNVGLLKREKKITCLALNMAHALRKLIANGFKPIKVNAFSNLNLANFNVYAIFTRMNHLKKAIEICTISSQKNYEAFSTILLQKNNIENELYKIERQLEKKRVKNTLTVSKLDDQQKHWQMIKDKLQNIERQIMDLLTKNKLQRKLTARQFSPIDQSTLRRLQQSKDQLLEKIELSKVTKIPGKNLKSVSQAFTRLEKKAFNLRNEIASLQKRAEKYIKIIERTKDVRKTLDKNPAYHFSTLANYIDKGSKNIFMHINSKELFSTRKLSRTLPSAKQKISA